MKPNTRKVMDTLALLLVVLLAAGMLKVEFSVQWDRATIATRVTSVFRP